MARSCFSVKDTFQTSVHKKSAKRSQHANSTYRTIVGSNKLCAFGHPVKTYCCILGVVGSSLKMVKFSHTYKQGGNFGICCAEILRSFDS